MNKAELLKLYEEFILESYLTANTDSDSLGDFIAFVLRKLK